MRPMSDLLTSELAFAAFVIVALCAFAVILLEVATNAVFEARSKRAAARSRAMIAVRRSSPIHR